MNWLDWTVVGFLAVSVIAGFREGFIRIGINFVALLAAFIAASWFYRVAGAPLTPYISSRVATDIIGFVSIFLAVILAGSLLAALLVRMFHLIGLSPVDRVLGGLLGGARAAFLVVIAGMLMLAFAPRQLPGAVETSTCAPYIFRGARMLSAATPYEIRRAVDNTVGIVKDVVTRPGKLIVE